MRIAYLILFVVVVPRAFAGEDAGSTAPERSEDLAAEMKACDAGQLPACLRAMDTVGKTIKEAKDETSKRSFSVKRINVAKRLCELEPSAILNGMDQMRKIMTTDEGRKFIRNYMTTDKAREALRRFELAVSEMCSELGRELREGRAHVAKDPAAAARCFKKACDGGINDACEWLAYMLGEGEGLRRDVALAIELRKKPCEKGHLPSCANLGIHLANADKPDMPRAMKLFKKACDGGSLFGCAHLGLRLFKGGKGIRVDKKKGRALLEKACASGVSLGCFVLASADEKKKGGDGGLRWRSAEIAAYSAGCDGGKLTSCVWLGDAYRFGSGVGKDGERARTFYQRACEGGSGVGCYGVFVTFFRPGNSSAEVREAARAFTKARKLLAEGCERGRSDDCQSHGEAQELRSKLVGWCDKNGADACDLLKAIRAVETGK